MRGKPDRTNWLAAAGLTLIAEVVPVMAGFDVSVAVIVWLPAVLRVTVNVAVPSSDEGKVKVAGREAWGSVLVKSIVPVKLVSVVPLGVWAVTVRLNELPAVWGLDAVRFERVVRGRGADQRARDQIGDGSAQAGNVVVPRPCRVLGVAVAGAGGDVVEVGRVLVEDVHHLLRTRAVERRFAAQGSALVGDGQEGRPARCPDAGPAYLDPAEGLAFVGVGVIDGDAG